MPLLSLALHQKEEFQELIIWGSNKDTNKSYEKNSTYMHNINLVGRLSVWGRGEGSQLMHVQLIEKKTQQHRSQKSACIAGWRNLC